MQKPEGSGRRFRGLYSHKLIIASGSTTARLDLLTWERRASRCVTASVAQKKPSQGSATEEESFCDSPRFRRRLAFIAACVDGSYLIKIVALCLNRGVAIDGRR